MKLKFLIFFITIFSLSISGFCQNQNPQNVIRGKVTSINEQGKKEALVGANVYWINSTQGTITDQKGEFALVVPSYKADLKIVFSYIGYKTDTFEYQSGSDWVDVKLVSSLDLNEVEIKGKLGSAYFSKASVLNVQNLTGHEFTKAACCNLSESFETNASVDVSFSDAISGAKQIHLLGLAGKYVQLNMENIPAIRGLGSTYGLLYVPGPWMESIQISKGASSVRTGYESITGQINYEYKKPDTAERIFFNMVGNQFGKAEVNLYSAHKLSKKLSTMVFYHGELMSNQVDANKDGFVEIPLGNQTNVFNRWKYNSDYFKTQFGVSYLNEIRQGGQLEYDFNKSQNDNNAYGIEIKTSRIEAFWKGAFFFKNKPYQNLAFLQNFTHHDQHSFFGFNNYSGLERNYKGTLVFSSIIGNTNHEYNAGFDFVYDDYNETLNTKSFQRTEIIPGLFIEYTYKFKEKLALILGVRDDYHNIMGNMITPRMHIRYKLDGLTTIRTSIGKGYRSPNIFAENTSLLATSRDFIIDEDIFKEEAWNYGLFLTREFLIGEQPLNVNLDFYRTEFVNQLIVDLDQNKNEIHLYNLNGKSFANSAQIEINYEPIERFDILLAYRYNDVKSTYNGDLRSNPLVKKSKGLLNLSYRTEWDKWQFDYILQYNGVSRLPNTALNPSEFNEEFTPDFFIMNAQVTKNFKYWTIYGGIENITNFVQEKPIIAYDAPFSNGFDASQVWGPIIGRKYYVGVKIKFF